MLQLAPHLIDGFPLSQQARLRRVPVPRRHLITLAGGKLPGPALERQVCPEEESDHLLRRPIVHLQPIDPGPTLLMETLPDISLGKSGHFIIGRHQEGGQDPGLALAGADLREGGPYGLGGFRRPDERFDAGPSVLIKDLTDSRSAKLLEPFLPAFQQSRKLPDRLEQPGVSSRRIIRLEDTLNVFQLGKCVLWNRASGLRKMAVPGDSLPDRLGDRAA